MKAAHYDRYGGPEVFTVIDKAKPKAGKDEVLVKVYCTTVNRTDTGMTSAIYFVSRFFTGLFGPKRKTPGTDFSGVIAEIGADVTRFKEGDEVFGFEDSILSSQAEYMVIKSKGKILHKPLNVSHREAAASLEGPHYAINMLNYIDLKKGDKVLVNGATGGIGSALVQILRDKGAVVTAVTNTKNLGLASELGANKVYNFEEEDFTKKGEIYDFILDAVGKSSFRKCRPLLTKDGIYISSELGKNGINIWLALTNSQVKFPVPSDIDKTLVEMKRMLEEERFKPVIDRVYPLDNIREAYEYVTSGEKTGNVILEISASP